MNKLVQKWKSTGLLEGIEDELRKEFVATNLEESAKWLVKTANYSNEQIDSELLSAIILPCVCRISRKMVFKIKITDAIERSMSVFTSIIQILPEYNRIDINEIELKLTDIMENVLYFTIKKEEQNYDKVQDSEG